MALYLFILGNEASESDILHMVTNPFLISFVGRGGHNALATDKRS